MNKKIVFAAVLVTAAGLITAGIAPAQAAGAPTLPSNQHFFALDCDNFDPQLWSVDSTNANATRVGTITPTQTECPFSAVQNPVDGKNYVVMGGGAEYLATVDTTTGLYNASGTTLGGTEKVAVALIGDGIIFGKNPLSLSKVEERADKSYSMQVYTQMDFGATRMEEAKVLQLIYKA